MLYPIPQKKKKKEGTLASPAGPAWRDVSKSGCAKCSAERRRKFSARCRRKRQQLRALIACKGSVAEASTILDDFSSRISGRGAGLKRCDFEPERQHMPQKAVCVIRKAEPEGLLQDVAYLNRHIFAGNALHGPQLHLTWCNTPAWSTASVGTCDLVVPGNHREEAWSSH